MWYSLLVCDESARTLNNSERKAITSYLEIIKTNASFASFHKDQDVLKDESCWNKVLGCIPNEETRNTLKNRWSENPSQTSWIDRNIW
ncbi:10959_t:CDS:2 [Entrophospora sp. SA101]|nr:10959_t:CDS:2 [Entrophospora sp. SA101]